MKRARPSVDLLSHQEAENFPEVNNIHTLEMKNIYWSLFRILTIAERKQIIIMFDNQLRTISITWFRKKRKCQGSTQCEGLRDDKAKYNGWQTERESERQMPDMYFGVLVRSACKCQGEYPGKGGTQKFLWSRRTIYDGGTECTLIECSRNFRWKFLFELRH